MRNPYFTGGHLQRTDPPALQAVIAGLGPIQIDAMGTCGKLFQGVPSSGGSHYFLVLKADEEITIGGEAQ